MNNTNSRHPKNDQEAHQAAIHASRRGAVRVFAGIFLSRISGLVREAVFAHYFGSSDAADAFKAAYKIPNFLQNLFGEGVLSASFIPVYAKLLAEGDEETASRLAGVIASLLAVCTSILVLAGVYFTPYLIDAIAPGFHGAKRDLTIRLVQIFFPGTGLLVMSAWCLGILNSHRRFFLSYFAPVMWNAAIISTIWYFGGREMQDHLAQTAAWGLVVGSALQFLVQLPLALKLKGRLYFGITLKMKSVRTVLVNFVPVIITRGVVQISAYIDNVLASFLPTGTVSNLAYSQLLAVLPLSLFGASVSAAALPNMSGMRGDPEAIAHSLRGQLEEGFSQVAFFIIPSVIALLGFGDLMIAALFQSGSFGHDNTLRVWAILIGSAVGLLGATFARVATATYYALGNTRTPLGFASIRVVMVTALGYFCGLKLPGLLGISPVWGAMGLTASASLSAWVEFVLLKRALHVRIGRVKMRWSLIAKLFAIAIVAFALGWAVRTVAPHERVLRAACVLIPYGFAYLGLAYYFKLGEAERVWARLRRFMP